VLWQACRPDECTPYQLIGWNALHLGIEVVVHAVAHHNDHIAGLTRLPVDGKVTQVGS